MWCHPLVSLATLLAPSKFVFTHLVPITSAILFSLTASPPPPHPPNLSDAPGEGRGFEWRGSGTAIFGSHRPKENSSSDLRKALNPVCLSIKTRFKKDLSYHLFCVLSFVWFLFFFFRSSNYEVSSQQPSPLRDSQNHVSRECSKIGKILYWWWKFSKHEPEKQLIRLY